MDERIVAFEEGREEEGVSVVLIVTDLKRAEFKEEEGNLNQWCLLL